MVWAISFSLAGPCYASLLIIRMNEGWTNSAKGPSGGKLAARDGGFRGGRRAVTTPQ